MALADVVTDGFRLHNLTSNLTANTLTNNGSVAFTTGKLGDCAQFDGSNYLSGGDWSEWKVGDKDWTVACWVYITSLPAAYADPIGKRVTGGDFTITIYSDGGWNPAIVTSAGIEYFVPTSTLSTSTWHLIRILYRSSTKELGIGLDNELAEWMTITGDYPLTDTDSLNIGKSEDRGLIGEVDAAYFFAVVDDNALMAELWNSGAGWQDAAETPPSSGNRRRRLLLR